MSDHRVISLYSGSAGNCTLISAAGVNILIDAGKSARSLCTALNAAGSDIRSISAIFVTHEHSDHVSALEVISKKYNIPVHMTSASAGHMLMGQYLCSSAVTHPPLFSVDVGGVTVSSFPTSHDSACSVGYRVEFDRGDGSRCAVGCATDTGCVTEAIRAGLCGCESVVLECNHDEDMLRTGPYPYQLKMRIMSREGHLSNGACAAFAAQLAEAGTKNILLAHLSRENNTPDAAYAAVRCALPQDITLAVAHPDEIVRLV